jgi:PucR family transcriptional regulator, purine catabolism regulatory protein
VAGTSGTRREVVWCTTLRARPPAFTPLRGGELLLIDPQVLTAVDSRLTLARLLESLAGQGVAGAAIAGRVSAEARRAADTHGLPLFALPATMPLDQVEQQVLRYIVDRRAELHERAQDLHRQLSELALAGRGLPALLARLHELTGVPVLLERDSGVDYVGGGRLPDSAAAAIAAERPALEEWLREVPLSAFDPPVALRPLVDGQARLIAPIMVAGSIAGFVSLLGADGELGEMHRLAVGRAAHACAIELVRARAAHDARDEVEEELLDVLTAGRPGSHQAARERARRKGFDVDAPYLVIAAEPVESGLAPKVRAAWERLLATMRLTALVRERGDAAMALISLNGRRAPEPRALIDQLHRAARASGNGPVTLGYGAVRSGASEVAAGAREAEQALTMGRRLFGPDSATAFKDLGLYRLLYALQPLPEVRAFRDDALARLRAKDRAGVLLQTLGAYLAANGSPTDAAERLHLHRNTVLYRLGRIEDLLGVDLRDAEVRLSLHLALKIGDVLEG